MAQKELTRRSMLKEEEFHIAGGSTDTIAALRGVRTVSDAVLVCKRGPMARWRSRVRSPTA